MFTVRSMSDNWCTQLSTIISAWTPLLSIRCHLRKFFFCCPKTAIIFSFSLSLNCERDHWCRKITTTKRKMMKEVTIKEKILSISRRSLVGRPLLHILDYTCCVSRFSCNFQESTANLISFYNKWVTKHQWKFHFWFWLIQCYSMTSFMNGRLKVDFISSFFPRTKSSVNQGVGVDYLRGFFLFNLQ